MSLTPRVLPLDITPPTYPDVRACSATYGTNIVPAVCQRLVDANWPSGDTPIDIYFQDPAPSNAILLPYTLYDIGCVVSIEAAGINNPNAEYLTVAPNKLRGLAGYVIQKCPVESRGFGGFVTFGMSHVMAFVRQWRLGIDSPGRNDSGAFSPNKGFKAFSYSHSRQAQRLSDSNFLTISIYSNTRDDFRPGDTDPIIAAALSSDASIYLRKWNPLNNAQSVARQLADFLRSRSISMAAGSSLTWWEGLPDPQIEPESNEDADSEDQDPQTSKDPGNMTYQCDSSLGGAPDPKDCEKLSWSGLKPSDSVEVLQAHVPRFYFQDTCALGISSEFPTTITWAHLLTAFSTLYNLCVSNSFQSAKGGRAYYGQQSISSWISGKRDSISGVNGSEALPPGINATLFKHGSSANINCEWTLAQEGKDITMCEALK